MEKPQFDGKAIEGLLELVENREQKQQHSQQSSADAPDHSRTKAAEDARRVL